MSVLVYAESPKGQIKKGALETVSYASKVAKLMGVDCHALTLGAVTGAEVLGQYGATKVHNVANDQLANFDSQVYSTVIAEAAGKVGASVVIVSHSSSGKSILGRLAVKLNAGSVAGVNTLPDLTDGFTIGKNVFSGKAMAKFQISSEVKVLSLMGNAMAPEVQGENVGVEALAIDVPTGRIKVKEVKTIEGTVPLPEAELVVSAGRGMKDPGNWGIIEELANEMGATTACSRPVADTGWRPHHEHVGQTGVAIRPNLYIAVGISGAIQHLAGVNSSKVIVVINKDPEAPFFKGADYGVCGDLFDVVPRLTEAYKKFKAAN